MFDHRHYVPILKWRQGEYQALLESSDKTKEYLTPLIEIPPIEWDFELGKHAKNLDDHIKNVGERVASKWGIAPIFVDLSLIDEPKALRNGQHVVERVFGDLRAKGVEAVPVTSTRQNDSFNESVSRVIFTDRRGVVVRVSLEDLADNIDDRIEALIILLGIMSPAEIDLVIDLADADFDPIDDLADLLLTLIDASHVIASARTFTVAGTAFPDSMSKISSFVEIVPRNEWLLYKAMIRKGSADRRVPTFGDYAIASSELPRGDMRIMKPSATLRYTIDDAWRITKGSNVKDNGFGQYVDICEDLVSDSSFSGIAFSYGDRYISDCSIRVLGTGNLMIWRKIGTNHHLAKVVSDLASLHGS